MAIHRSQDANSGNRKLSPPQNYRRILDFWHKVEFFIPFDLEKQILDHADKDWAVRRITAKQLASLPPQTSGDIWNVSRVPSGKRLSGFELYLGIFDMELSSRVVQNVLQQKPTVIEAIDDFERGDYEGLTCFAKIELNSVGVPDWDGVSVSTLPWALGRLKSLGIGALDFDAFQSSLKTLKYQLADFQTQRLKQGLVGQQSGSKKPLRGNPLVRAEIEQLVNIFYSWADFTPDQLTEFPVVVIKALAVDELKNKAPSTDECSNANSASKNTSAPQKLDNISPDDEDDADDKISIFNSFYVKDIQRAIKSLNTSDLPSALLAYLTPVPISKRVSVYLDKGRQQIRSSLHPSNLPLGHWLGEPGHNMSLMQQFAINEGIETMKESCLFSVNGPPGTGKTTLLRDIFAEIITQRARVLAECSNARAAFEQNKVVVEFNDGTTAKISSLSTKLTGFEIVVASTNNAAVENISHDLPKSSALGSQTLKLREELAWRHKDGTPKLTYLQPVAAQYAARNAKGEFDQLSPDDSPWGLVACALGSRTNQRRFKEGVFDKAVKKVDEIPNGFDPKLHKSIWEWRDNYNGPTFLDAAALFKKADVDVSEYQNKLAEYIDALEETEGINLDDYTFTQLKSSEKAEVEWQAAQAEWQYITGELAAIKNKLESIEQLKQLNTKPIISKFKWLFSRQARSDYIDATRTYEDNEKQYRKIHANTILKKYKFEPKLPSADSKLSTATFVRDNAKDRLKKRQARWVRFQTTRATLMTQFPDVESQWRSSSDIENNDKQKNGLWANSEFNLLRSQLFAAALTLHEAWLGEVSQNGGGFGSNLVAISSIFEGKQLNNPDHAKLIWQSLFMMVPVVSSTFASIATQFRELGPKSIGWLFIDEAGQAVPQAAVGALWRCQWAMVVGDPLQIEPVFTVPTKLIEELGKSSGIAYENVAPNKCSVQNLADHANVFGADVADKSTKSKQTWIGSPLRVHRRCSDPMFNIANKIAYEDKMIFGSANKQPPSDSLNLDDSAWVQIAGATKDKQVVPEQIDLVIKCLITLAKSIGHLPPVYIISPFRSIASTLRTRLTYERDWLGVSKSDGKPLTKSAVSKWGKSHIGTVHTFQGKQSSIVWMVLGCDKESAGAVSWASRKPNILNVALTRAEHRFFMIGDLDVWGSREYFCRFTPPNVPQISAMDFMARIENLKNLSPNEIAPHLKV